MIYGIIPARLESTRLPRKMLLAETGKPLIQHTWEAVIHAASRIACLDEVIVATDSGEIAAAVRSFGGRVEMTGPHNSGTERCAEVAKRLSDAKIIVNIQGDEPDIDPQDIEYVAMSALHNAGASASTLATEATPEDLADAACVKIILDDDRNVLDFVREGATHGALRHIGVYAFRAAELQRLVNLPQHPDEVSRRLEQLRWLRAGARIEVVEVLTDAVGIDTPEDYRRFVERYRNG